MKRAAFVGLFLAATIACDDGNDGSPTSPSCSNIAGTWDIAATNSCGFQSSGAVVVAQSACNFSAAVPLQGTVQGTINGSRASFTLAFASPCGGSATGTATIFGNAVNGTFSGRATGQGCCDPVSGSFTLTNRR
jgi:hypothetical protein